MIIAFSNAGNSKTPTQVAQEANEWIKQSGRPIKQVFVTQSSTANEVTNYLCYTVTVWYG